MAPRRIFVIAGEASGDQLGARLLREMRLREPSLEIAGIGGEAMAAEGLESLFPLSEIAVMGLGPVVRRLPSLIRRISEAKDAVLRFRPDVLVTIDSPDFTKRVAKRVRAAEPGIRTVHWVCPSVWAWRPGRAPAMRPYLDHILCLLPFEPAALARLNGPAGTYVGHPLIERLAEYRPANADDERARQGGEGGKILILPGSRMAEIRRLLPIFLESLPIIEKRTGAQGWVIPTLPHLEAEVRRQVAATRMKVEVLVGETAKLAAFRAAWAAMAASGTVTLELALAAIPTVAAYRVANWEAAIARRLVTINTALLPNLVLGERFMPEFLQDAAHPEALATALLPLLAEGPERESQLAAFRRVEGAMRLEAGERPSARAADIVLGEH
jgi:lipid-A-disaccharide synthase